MQFVYVVISGEGHYNIVGIYANEAEATCHVNLCAQNIYGIDPTTDPVDFEGALMRYGWADLVWWQKEVLYD